VKAAAVRKRQQALLAAADRAAAEGIAPGPVEAVRAAATGELQQGEAEAQVLEAICAREAALERRKEAVEKARAELAAFATRVEALEQTLGSTEARLLQAIAAARQERARKEREARAARAREEAAKAQERAAKAGAARSGTGRVRIQAEIDLASDSNFFAGFDDEASGVFVATVKRLRVGTPVEVELGFEGRRLPLNGSVRFSREAGWADRIFPGVGIEIERFPEEIASAVRAFVRAREPMFFPD
jgi:hypothetical protein